jgi:hypothetical protein
VPSRTDTLLGQCILRGVRAVADEDLSTGRRVDTDVPSAWDRVRAITKGSNRASTVAAFITMWAVALEDLGRDSIGIEEYAAWASESTATVYRRQADFRALWPEHETPNEIARLLLDASRRSGAKPSPMIALAVS